MTDPKETLLNDVCPDWREAVEEALKSSDLERFMEHVKKCQRCQKAMDKVVRKLVKTGTI
jgi:hypothetical protein